MQSELKSNETKNKKLMQSELKSNKLSNETKEGGRILVFLPLQRTPSNRLDRHWYFLPIQRTPSNRLGWTLVLLPFTAYSVQIGWETLLVLMLFYEGTTIQFPHQMLSLEMDTGIATFTAYSILIGWTDTGITTFYSVLCQIGWETLLVLMLFYEGTTIQFPHQMLSLEMDTGIATSQRTPSKQAGIPYWYFCYFTRAKLSSFHTRCYRSGPNSMFVIGVKLQR